MNNPIDISSFYEHRVIVLFEDAPLTNKYRQVLVDEEQFRLISEAIIGEQRDMIGDDGEVYEVNMAIDDRILVDLPETFQSIYKGEL